MPRVSIDIKKIVTKDDPKLLVEAAKELATRHINPSSNQKQATKTQIRRLFSSLKNIDYSWPRKLDDDQSLENRDKAYRELLLLAPRLSYEAGRHTALKEICDVVIEGIGYISKDDRKTFERLVEFYEAVLGYYVGLKEA